MARTRRDKLKAFERGTILAKIIGAPWLMGAAMTASPVPAIVVGAILGVVYAIDKELDKAQRRLDRRFLTLTP